MHTRKEYKANNRLIFLFERSLTNMRLIDRWKDRHIILLFKSFLMITVKF